jgi:hypothetical protein
MGLGNQVFPSSVHISNVWRRENLAGVPIKGAEGSSGYWAWVWVPIGSNTWVNPLCGKPWRDEAGGYNGNFLKHGVSKHGQKISDDSEIDGVGIRGPEDGLVLSRPTHNVVLEELYENEMESMDQHTEGPDTQPGFEQLKDLFWANRENQIKKREKRRSWRDIEELYRGKSMKSSTSKKKGGRRRTPKEVEVLENEESLIAFHNEILKDKHILADSLEVRARRVWSIGKQVGLRSKGLEEAIVNRLKVQLAENEQDVGSER